MDQRNRHFSGKSLAIHPPEIHLPTYALSDLRPPHNRDCRPPSVGDFPAPTDPPPAAYTLTHVPSPVIVSSALDAFYTCTGSLFFVVPREQSFELFRSVYWGSTKRTKPILAELCALVSVGAQYDDDGPMTEDMKFSFFNTTKVYLEELARTSPLRLMRVFTLCCMFSIMEKRTAAWTYIVSALDIAHEHGLHQKYRPLNGPIDFSEREWGFWRRVWRSMKFFESWLAGSLGRIPKPFGCEIDIENVVRKFSTQQHITAANKPSGCGLFCKNQIR